MSTTKQIRSKNSLFKGQLVDKPKKALFSPRLDEDGEEMLICPTCGNVASLNDCDVCGAEPNCCFCNQCNREMEL